LRSRPDRPGRRGHSLSVDAAGTQGLSTRACGEAGVALGHGATPSRRSPTGASRQFSFSEVGDALPRIRSLDETEKSGLARNGQRCSCAIAIQPPWPANGARQGRSDVVALARLAPADSEPAVALRAQVSPTADGLWSGVAGKAPAKEGLRRRISCLGFIQLLLSNANPGLEQRRRGGFCAL